jgi:hypothetical protein
MTELVVRAARKDDAAFLAWAVVEAARSHRPRGFWDLWVPDGGARLAFVERLLVAQSPSMWHWTVFQVAEWGGRPAATLSGCDPSLFAPADVAVGEGMVASGWSEAERAGFAITAEKRAAALDAAIGCPGIAQMSCPL